MPNLQKLKLLGKWWKPFIPPVVVSTFTRFLPRNRWLGSYPSWQEAQQDSLGYSERNILARVEASVKKVLDGEAAFERDGVTFGEPEPNFPLLSALLQATGDRKEISVVDFGGSLGSTYLQNKSWLNGSVGRWMIIEQPAVVAAGTALYRSKELEFYADASSAKSAAQAGPIFLHSAAVLQYLPDPFSELKKIIEVIEPEWIFLDRLPYVDAKEHRLTVQHVPDSIYKASYPCWFFSKGSVRAELEHAYDMVFVFPSLDQCVDFSAHFEGSFWRRKPSGRS